MYIVLRWGLPGEMENLIVQKLDFVLRSGISKGPWQFYTMYDPSRIVKHLLKMHPFIDQLKQSQRPSGAFGFICFCSSLPSALSKTSKSSGQTVGSVVIGWTTWTGRDSSDPLDRPDCLDGSDQAGPAGKYVEIYIDI
jgi:hypothetical protein